VLHWLIPKNLTSQEAEISGGSYPLAIVHETLSQKNNHKKRAGGVVQVIKASA
jgi:hypothetical protein